MCGSPRPGPPPRPGEQREDAALALVVGTHDQEDVFDGDDDDQCPESHRQNAKHVFRVESKAVLRVEALTEGVNRACPDIAEHDAERGHAQPGETGGGIRPMLATLLFFCQRGVSGRNRLGRGHGVAGTVCHALLLLTAAEGPLSLRWWCEILDMRIRAGHDG